MPDDLDVAASCGYAALLVLLLLAKPDLPSKYLPTPATADDCVAIRSEVHTAHLSCMQERR